MSASHPAFSRTACPTGRCRRTRLASRRPVQPTPPPGLGELTPREVEVLVAMGRGLSNAEIAAEFVVSVATVKTHVKRVLTKLRLSSRAGAVVVAYEVGLITPRYLAR